MLTELPTSKTLGEIKQMRYSLYDIKTRCLKTVKDFPLTGKLPIEYW